jgi:hypothetical protein
MMHDGMPVCIGTALNDDSQLNGTFTRFAHKTLEIVDVERLTQCCDSPGRFTIPYPVSRVLLSSIQRLSPPLV